VDFHASLPRGELALVAGTEDRYFLIPCIEAPGTTGSAICNFKLPVGTAISILDVFQFLVNGYAIDLPEILKLDLEMKFRLPFDLSDLEPLTLEKAPNFTYLLKMKAKYAPFQVRVRCSKKEEFVYQGEVLGTIDRFSETVFYQDQLPIEGKNGEEFVVRASCQNQFPSEVLVTDGLLYTSRPRF